RTTPTESKRTLRHFSVSLGPAAPPDQLSALHHVMFVAARFCCAAATIRADARRCASIASWPGPGTIAPPRSKQHACFNGFEDFTDAQLDSNRPVAPSRRLVRSHPVSGSLSAGLFVCRGEWNSFSPCNVGAGRRLFESQAGGVLQRRRYESSGGQPAR